jgi:hypothetical protein
MRPEECRSYPLPRSAGRRGEERQRHTESPSGGRARGRGGWRPGGTLTTRSGPPERRERRVWPARGGDRRWRVGKAGRARRRARVGRRRGGGVAATVVDERGIGEASRGQRGRAWRRRDRRGRAWRRRGRRGRAWRRRDRRGRAWRRRGRRDCTWRRRDRWGHAWRGNGRERWRRGRTRYGNGARRGAGGEGTGSDSRSESRLVGGVEPARGNTSSSKTM